MLFFATILSLISKQMVSAYIMLNHLPKDLSVAVTLLMDRRFYLCVSFRICTNYRSLGFPMPTQYLLTRRLQSKL